MTLTAIHVMSGLSGVWSQSGTCHWGLLIRGKKSGSCKLYRFGGNYKEKTGIWRVSCCADMSVYCLMPLGHV